DHPLLRAAHTALAASDISLPELASDVQLKLDTGDGRLFVTFAPVGRLDWIVGTVVPRSAFPLRTEQNTQNLIYLLAATVLAIGLLVLLLSRALLARPLSRIVHETAKIQRFELDDVKHVPTRIDEVAKLSEALQRTASGLSAF